MQSATRDHDIVITFGLNIYMGLGALGSHWIILVDGRQQEHDKVRRGKAVVFSAPGAPGT